MCSVLAREERNLRKGWSAGEQRPRVWPLHSTQPHTQGRNNIDVCVTVSEDLTGCVCVCSVGIKPVCCSITGTRHGLTTKLPTLRCHCCSWWQTWRQSDVLRPPWARRSSTAGTVAKRRQNLVSTHPRFPARLQCWDRPDRLLHRHDDRLPAAAAGGCGGRAKHYLSTPSRQVSRSQVLFLQCRKFLKKQIWIVCYHFPTVETEYAVEPAGSKCGFDFGLGSQTSIQSTRDHTGAVRVQVSGISDADDWQLRSLVGCVTRQELPAAAVLPGKCCGLTHMIPHHCKLRERLVTLFWLFTGSHTV